MSTETSTGQDVGAKKTDIDLAYRIAMKSLIAERWRDVWKAVPAAVAGTDIEGVHDVRVASRRLRAAMDVAVECFPASWYRPLHRVAKDITGALGEVRDRDVLLLALTAERDLAPPAERPGITRLIDRIERERGAAREEMESFLQRLMSGGTPNDVAARFGPAAGPPSAGGKSGRDQEAAT
ncbi:MAG: CHAD domain-containing protein [Chloroflexota bacterium]|nr:CHAD domain-containing protein [Chloroflexota bacterium]